MNPPEIPDDATLARLAREGSTAAFGTLVTRHHQRVFSFLLALTRHRQDAEDLTQETFLRAWKKLHRFDPELPLLPWLFTIGRRLSISALRRKRPIPPEADFPVSVETGNQALWLWEIARFHLTPDAYSALWLHYREELSLREIGTIMGKREGTVKVILHRARKALAEKVHQPNPSATATPFSEPHRMTP